MATLKATTVLAVGRQPVALAAAPDTLQLATKADLITWVLGGMSVLVLLTWALVRRRR